LFTGYLLKGCGENLIINDSCPDSSKKITTDAYKVAQMLYRFPKNKEKTPQVNDLRGLNLVGDTWIEHVTPAV
jgi:hypothetical protein